MVGLMSSWSSPATKWPYIDIFITFRKSLLPKTLLPSENSCEPRILEPLQWQVLILVPSINHHAMKASSVPPIPLGIGLSVGSDDERHSPRKVCCSLNPDPNPVLQDNENMDIQITTVTVYLNPSCPFSLNLFHCAGNVRAIVIAIVTSRKSAVRRLRDAALITQS